MGPRTLLELKLGEDRRSYQGKGKIRRDNYNYYKIMEPVWFSAFLRDRSFFMG